jgi:hypothetical protein
MHDRLGLRWRISMIYMKHHEIVIIGVQLYFLYINNTTATQTISKITKGCHLATSCMFFI